MVEDTSQEYAVPRYRDPERAARIVEARRRGETYKEISAREGVSPERIRQIYRKAVLTVRHPPKPCARPGCGKPVPRRTSIHCSQKCAVAARSSASPAKAFYERRRDTGAKWSEVAGLDRRSALEPANPAKAASLAAGHYAKANGLPWPLPGRPPPPPPPPEPCARAGCGKPVVGRSAVYCSRQCAVAARRAEHMARRDEEGMAEIREMVERERRVLALLDELPKDRTISRDEAERFLVELYRTGMRFSHIAKRTNCFTSYVKEVVRRRAPELARSREPRGKKKPPLGLLLDFRELRKAWRFARPCAPKNTWAISRGEGIHDRE